MGGTPTRRRSRDGTLPTTGRDDGGIMVDSERAETLLQAIPPLHGEGGSQSETGGVPSRMSQPVSRARALRKRMTPHEVKLWVRLRELRDQGLHFRRQAPFLGYVLDFVCFDRRLVVEVDGSQHAMGPQLAKDTVRDAHLSNAGFEVLRFWNADVDRDFDAVIDTIFMRAMARPPTRRRTGGTLPTRGRENGATVETEQSQTSPPPIPPLHGEGGSRSETGGGRP